MPEASPDAPPTPSQLRDIARVVQTVARRTPLLACEALGRDTGCQVWFKPENLQSTGSYKVRGAYAKIQRLDTAARARGVVTASAGNHAQGVALAASRLRVPAVVVMPVNAPIAKVVATRDLGADVVLHGDTFEQAEAEAQRLRDARGLTIVHPFDDWDVIAGQASVALEVLADFPAAAGSHALEALVVPVGGGGLLAGAALAVSAAEHVGHRPRLIGVQARGADAAVRSLAVGHAVTLASAHTIADGIRVRRPGDRPLQAMLGRIDDMVTVADEEIARAVVYVLERAKLVVEPAGAVGVAALLSGALRFQEHQHVCLVLSGGNVDVNVVARIIEHGLTRAGRYLVLRTRLDDRPGQLAALLQPLSVMRVNVIDIEHHRAGWLLPVDQSDVVLHLETRDLEHARQIVAALHSAGYAAEPLTPLHALDNEPRQDARG